MSGVRRDPQTDNSQAHRLSREKNTKCEVQDAEKKVRKCVCLHVVGLHHEWNKNDAPLGSISLPLHTTPASKSDNKTKALVSCDSEFVKEKRVLKICHRLS